MPRWRSSSAIGGAGAVGMPAKRSQAFPWAGSAVADRALGLWPLMGASRRAPDLLVGVFIANGGSLQVVLRGTMGGLGADSWSVRTCTRKCVFGSCWSRPRQSGAESTSPLRIGKSFRFRRSRFGELIIYRKASYHSDDRFSFLMEEAPVSPRPVVFAWRRCSNPWALQRVRVLRDSDWSPSSEMVLPLPVWPGRFFPLTVLQCSGGGA